MVVYLNVTTNPSMAENAVLGRRVDVPLAEGFFSESEAFSLGVFGDVVSWSPEQRVRRMLEVEKSAENMRLAAKVQLAFADACIEADVRPEHVWGWGLVLAPVVH